MERKNNQSKKIIVFLIIIIMILLVSMVILLLTNKKDEISNKNIITSNKTTNNTTSKTKGSFSYKFEDFPKNNDNNVNTFDLMNLLNDDKVNINVNFKNIDLNKYSLNYTVSCTQYDESDIDRFGYGCSGYQFKIGDLILEDNQDEGCGHINRVISVDNYFIVQHAVGCDEGCGHIDIYKNYKLLYTIKSTQIWGIKDLQTEDGIMKYTDDKLYYFVTPDENHISLKSIDLNSDKLIETTIETNDYDYVYCNYDE